VLVGSPTKVTVCTLCPVATMPVHRWCRSSTWRLQRLATVTE